MNICVIDDEKSLCTALASFIRRLGPYNVFTLTDSREELDFIRRHDIELLITDVRMPYKSGLDIVCELKKNDIAIEIILISGQSDIIESINAIELGVHDFLTKPVDVTKIARIVETIEKKKHKNPLSIST